MPQTVYDIGDPITSRLTLGVTPDGTTQATVTITRPDGTAITPTAVSGFVGDTKTAQWYATDDGTPTGATLFSAGDWLAVWRVTGTGANVAAKIYNVAPLPGTGTRVVWSPFLSQVADHVPYLTVDTTPGTEIYLGTFRGDTIATDEVAQRHIDAAVNLTLLPGLTTPLFPAATAVAALRAAASLARAYMRRPEDLQTAAALDARADAYWVRLKDAVVDLADGAEDGFFDVAPVWTFDRPDPRFGYPGYF